MVGWLVALFVGGSDGLLGRSVGCLVWLVDWYVGW